jgi:hypothetical protein
VGGKIPQVNKNVLQNQKKILEKVLGKEKLKNKLQNVFF